MCCTRFILWSTLAQICLVVDKLSLVSLDLAGLSAGGTRVTNEFAGTELQHYRACTCHFDIQKIHYADTTVQSLHTDQENTQQNHCFCVTLRVGDYHGCICEF